GYLNLHRKGGRIHNYCGLPGPHGRSSGNLVRPSEVSEQSDNVAFDTLARPWVEQVKPLLGTMIVENIGGGGSSLGATAVARARADGYTILLGGTLPHVNEALFKSRPLYDPVKDLDPIAGLAVVALALAVHPSVPAQNLKEFVAYAKANAGKLSYG